MFIKQHFLTLNIDIQHEQLFAEKLKEKKEIFHDNFFFIQVALPKFSFVSD